MSLDVAQMGLSDMAQGAKRACQARDDEWASRLRAHCRSRVGENRRRLRSWGTGCPSLQSRIGYRRGRRRVVRAASSTILECAWAAVELADSERKERTSRRRRQWRRSTELERPGRAGRPVRMHEEEWAKMKSAKT